MPEDSGEWLSDEESPEEQFHEGGEVIRVITPRGRQVLGIVEQALGAKRFKVRCSDKRLRLCRVPGRMKRSVWVKEGMLVLVMPWDLEGESKGDIVYKYSRTQQSWMQRRGYLKDFDEF